MQKDQQELFKPKQSEKNEEILSRLKQNHGKTAVYANKHISGISEERKKEK